MTHLPVIVRAHLAAGIAQAAPWGIALDGLLAAVQWSRMKASWRQEGTSWQRARDTAVPPDLDLPLARCDHPGDSWHWAATCAWPEQATGRTDVHAWSARIDPRDLEHVAATLPQVVSSRNGRFRSRRMPLLVTPCRSVTWRAVGEPAHIRDLLDDVWCIGKKRAAGEGQVLRWEVRAAPELDDLTAGHLHPDGSLGRPTPAACRQLLGQVPDGGVGRAGLRPPYMHPGRQQDLHLPALLGS